MSFETTVTELDTDATSQQFIQGLRVDVNQREADLSVDGLSESILSRILGLFGAGKS